MSASLSTASAPASIVLQSVSPASESNAMESFPRWSTWSRGVRTASAASTFTTSAPSPPRRNPAYDPGRPFARSRMRRPPSGPGDGVSDDTTLAAPGVLELVHAAEERGHVERGVEGLAAALPIGTLHLEDEALRLVPGGVRAEVDALGGIDDRQYGVEQPVPLPAHVLEICLHLPRPFEAA